LSENNPGQLSDFYENKTSADRVETDPETISNKRGFVCVNLQKMYAVDKLMNGISFIIGAGYRERI
jgi:hypothetical protein